MNLSQMQRIAKERKIGEVKEILLTATLLHLGWEMDNEIWLVQMKDGSKKILSTDHGGLCEMHVNQIQNEIQKTQNSLTELTEILVGVSLQ